MLDCKLCGITIYTTYLCEDCNKIKDACNLYSREVVWEVIKKVLIRNQEQREHKIKHIKLKDREK